VFSACATGVTPSVKGRFVEVVPREAAGAQRTQGELIEATPERLVLLGRNRTLEIPLPEVREVRVLRAGSLDRKKAVRWSLIGGLLTSAALMFSCSAADGDECGAVGAAVAGSWLVIGGLSTLGADGPNRRVIPATAWEDLRRYARFPQGLPHGLDPAVLASPPPR
jgi:hypothetical protein